MFINLLGVTVPFRSRGTANRKWQMSGPWYTLITSPSITQRATTTPPLVSSGQTGLEEREEHTIAAKSIGLLESGSTCPTGALYCHHFLVLLGIDGANQEKSDPNWPLRRLRWILRGWYTTTWYVISVNTHERYQLLFIYIYLSLVQDSIGNIMAI